MAPNDTSNVADSTAEIRVLTPHPPTHSLQSTTYAGEAVCDFDNASVDASARRYDAAPATLPIRNAEGTIWLRLDPPWLACAACAVLIDAHDRRGLLQRAIAAARSTGVDGTAALTTIGAIHACFWAGQAVRS
jgi:hypothetical protein